MTHQDHDHRQLQETLNRVRAVLANLNHDDPNPDRQRVVQALNNLCQRDITQPLTDEERSLLDFATRIEASTLGTPHAQQLRRQTSHNNIAHVLRRTDQLTEPTQPDPITGDHQGTAPATVMGILAKAQQATLAFQQGAKALQDHAALVTRLATTDAPATPGRLTSPAFHKLVISARAGDQHAATTLLTWIRPVIIRYCRTRIGRSAAEYLDADEVAQEICMAALGALARYGDEPESFLPFVYGIAHKVADHYRRAGHDRSDPAAYIPDGVDMATTSEQMIMAALLDTLPSRQREILVLRLFVGLTAEETAAALNVSPGVVRVTQHRALAKLSNLLTPAEKT